MEAIMHALRQNLRFITARSWSVPEVLSAVLAVALCVVGVLDFSKLQTFGLFLLPLILRLRNQVPRRRSIYGGLALVFLAVHLVFGQEYWLFATGLSTLFFLIEKKVGRMDSAAFYALIFYLPFTSGFFRVFGFYIRMWLTKWAAHTYAFFDPGVMVEGNQLLVHGKEYTVDAACMGLRLVVTAFLLTLVINQVLSRKLGRSLSRWYFIGMIKLSFALIVLANYMRILALIWAQSPEGSTSHELIGIVTFVAFHLIPMTLISRWGIRKFGKPASTHQAVEVSGGRGKLRWAWPPVLLFAIGWGVLVQHDDLSRIPIHAPSGYTLQKEFKRVSTFTSHNGGVLHVKAVEALSFSNHHPLVCWRGAGYSPSKEAQFDQGELSGFSAELNKGGQHLHTRWWYSDLQGNTYNDEWTWRFHQVLNGQQIFLINYSHPDPSQLIAEINRTQGEVWVEDELPQSELSSLLP